MPPPLAVQRRFLKAYVARIEASGTAVCDILTEALYESMGGGDETSEGRP